MKKTLSVVLSLTIALIYTLSVFAEVSPTAIEVSDYSMDSPKQYLNHIEETDEIRYDIYTSQINGTEYVVFQKEYSKYFHTRPLNLEEQAAHGTIVYDMVKAGDCYLARQSSADNAPIYIRTNTLKLLDENFNVLKTYDFSNINTEEKIRDFPFIIDMGYWDGKYYCTYTHYCEPVIDEDGQVEYVPYLGTKAYFPSYVVYVYTTVVSEDMENWTVIDEGTERNIDIIPRENSSVAMLKDSVSFDRETFYDINYEQDVQLTYLKKFGDWFVKRDAAGDIYLSNDNVYFVKINMQSYVAGHGNQYIVRLLYEAGDNIVIEVGELEDLDSSMHDYYHRAYVPKAEVYAQLNAMKEAYYVNLDGTVLGFEQPPVVENDRTLVPMRFLFEQIGAQVEWDENTQTATATRNGDSVTFGINSLSAEVNGQAVQTDVAPKLIGDKTYVPLRFLSENLGFAVDWNEELNMATIIAK